MWEEILAAVPTVGVYGAITFGAGGILYKVVLRMMDENKNREEKQTEILKEISDSVHSAMVTNKELSETNRLLVDKMSDNMKTLEGKIDTINSGVNQLLDKEE